MKTQRITLDDIATLAGVTKMTVSRFLRTPEKVKPATAGRIAAVITEIGYEAERESPVAPRAPRIGVLIPSFYNQIFADVLAGVESVAHTQGYQTLVVSYDYDLQREEEQIATVLALGVKGLILTGTVHTLRAEKYLQAASVPVAEVMGLGTAPGRINVGFDNYRAGFEMTRLLLKSGKQHIIYFGAMSDHRDEQRYAGYRDAMLQAQRPAGRIVPKRISSVSAGNEMMAQARQRYPQMDAIFCTNDDLAVGVLQACHQAGIAVPQTLAIAGFHGLDIGQVTTPGLASVITPRFEMGKIATERILQQSSGQPSAAEQMELAFRLTRGQTI